MKEIKRYSPVSFGKTPIRTEVRDNWTIAMAYDEEGTGPFLVDLSHLVRLDLQTLDLSSVTPFGASVPEPSVTSVLKDGVLINRMNKTQASVFQLPGNDSALPEEAFFTNVTESTLCLAILGKEVFSIMEKLSSLDFMDPALTAPFLFQGPCSHVPCQIVTLNREGESSGLMLTCSRGYGKDMVHSILDAGAEFGLKPGGEERFTAWINTL